MVLAACGKVAAPQATDAPTGDDAPTRTGTMIVEVSTTGNDANDGISQPVKTLKRGLGIALANGQIATVSVAAGRYDAANGETFPYTVPGGITIDGPAGGGAILAGSGSEPGLSHIGRDEPRRHGVRTHTELRTETRCDLR